MKFVRETPLSRQLCCAAKMYMELEPSLPTDRNAAPVTFLLCGTRGDRKGREMQKAVGDSTRDGKSRPSLWSTMHSDAMLHLPAASKLVRSRCVN